MLEACNAGYLTATDLADWLVSAINIPFREAHHITGRIVKEAETQSLALEALPLAAMQSIEPRITQDVFSVLSPAASLARRTSFGGTAPVRVREAIAAVKTRLSCA